MERTLALVAGVAAWIGVAAVAVLVVNAWRDENQILVFVPIALAVVLAWAIGEVVTDRVFGREKEADRGA